MVKNLLNLLFIVLRSLCFSIVFVTPWAVNAKLFSNAYLSFELPNHWKCQLEGTEWTCRSEFKEKSVQAIIVLTAKEMGPTDNLQSYKSYLSAPKVITSPNGTSQHSQVLHVRQKVIAGHDWVDGMHLGSEVPGFYTRYLATTKKQLAIVVTMSAHKKYYTQYSTDFIRAIESLKVVASKSMLSGRGNDALSNSTTHSGPSQQWFPINIPQRIQKIEALPGTENPNPSNQRKEKQSNEVILFLALLLMTGGVYIFLKKKKGRNP